MSDREMWPDDQNSGAPGPVAGNDGTVPGLSPDKSPTSPAWPSGPSEGSASPRLDQGQGFGARPHYPDGGPGYSPSAGQGYPPGGGQGQVSGQSYADPSYGNHGLGGPGYGPQAAANPNYPATGPAYGPPHGAPHGQPAYGQHFGGPAYGPPSYGQPPFGPYGGPPYGSYAEQPGPRPSGSSRGAKGMRSAAAVLVVVAAVLAGAGASRVIWPTNASATAAAPSVTTPSGGSGPGGYTVPFGSGGTGTGGTGEGAGGPSDVSAIAARVDPALVDINVAFNYQAMEGAGTGIVLTSNGLILTNNHVIDEATKISVTDVGNGQTYSATVVGYDNTHDVALIQLQGASGLTTAKIASSSASVGQAVVAIGNAGGTGGTPTSAGGSVTALDQRITASDELTDRSEQLTGLIEVNANVESGDSGGPLVNASGQVIGMDTAASESFAFSSQGNQGFAIPISYAMSIAKQIEAGKGSSTVHVGATAFLGVLLEAPSQTTSPFSGNSPFGEGSPTGGGSSTTSNGLIVQSVIAGTPAAKAGLGQGDTITTFNGAKVTSGEALTQKLVAYHPGQKVTLGWVTASGQTQTATVVLASGPPS